MNEIVNVCNHRVWLDEKGKSHCDCETSDKENNLVAEMIYWMEEYRTTKCIPYLEVAYSLLDHILNTKVAGVKK